MQAQDNREHDILNSDDCYQFMGGLSATVETLSGRAPSLFHLDTSRPEAPLARTLGEEISRVVRGRAANPKWIAGVTRHGYKVPQHESQADRQGTVGRGKPRGDWQETGPFGTQVVPTLPIS